MLIAVQQNVPWWFPVVGCCCWLSAFAILFGLAWRFGPRPVAASRLRGAIAFGRLNVLSQAERSFAPSLDSAVPAGCRVLCKVRVLDVLAVKAGVRWGGVGFMHFDFLVVSSEFWPFCAVELDDASHRLPRSIFNDRLKDLNCSAAGLPIVRVAVQRVYDVSDLRARIALALGGGRFPVV